MAEKRLCKLTQKLMVCLVVLRLLTLTVLPRLRSLCLLTFLIKLLISSTLVVEAYKGLAEATLPLMADTLATKSVLQTSVQSWWSQRSTP
jgi:hypothetical protein